MRQPQAKARATNAVQARSATSLLGFDERALPGAVRRSKNGSCREGPSSGRVDLRYGYLVQPRHVPVEVVAVHDSRSVSRPAHRRTALVGLIAAFVSFALLTGVAAADKVTTTFDGFKLGTVNGQDGWHSAKRNPDDPPPSVPALPNGYDRAGFVPSGGVAGIRRAVLASFQRLQRKHRRVRVPDVFRLERGECWRLIAANTEFVGEFQFTSTSPEPQDHVRMTISPDDGHRRPYVLRWPDRHSLMASRPRSSIRLRGPIATSWATPLVPTAAPEFTRSGSCSSWFPVLTTTSSMSSSTVSTSATSSASVLRPGRTSMRFHSASSAGHQQPLVPLCQCWG